ncbi:hypothetical protein FA95DRAFT_1351953 [Auriscalpium vulgare]|uniref:Uncharacterized protein n=1 Tax=Auriscalpium vulgare TaxID=40419 RepID=A0ACB8RR23_9AGAM|nr:hypothetical protein FA95DRAFT_1351953 [Auriscalpium vulgare]
MRLWRVLLFSAGLLSTALATALPRRPAREDTSREALKRELGGLLGGLDTQTTEVLHHTEPASTHAEHSTAEHATSAGGRTPTTQSAQNQPSEGTTTHAISSTTATPPPPTVATPTPTPHTQSPSPNATTDTPTSAPTTGTDERQTPASEHTGPDWRVIGVAVIAVSVIGAGILAVVFFDQWWGFLRDVCGGRRRKHKRGIEQLVPDWEKGSWEYKVEDDEGTGGDMLGQTSSGSGGSRARTSVIMAVTHLEVPPRPLLRAPSAAERYADPFAGVYAPRDANFISPTAQVYDYGQAHGYGEGHEYGQEHEYERSRVPGVRRSDTQRMGHVQERGARGSELQRANTGRSTLTSPVEDPYDGVAPDY